MSIVGVVSLLSGAPQHPVGDDGRMALSDHFRELRARLMRSTLILVVAFCVALYFYGDLLSLVSAPYRDAVHQLGTKVDTQLVVRDTGGGLLLQLKLCGVAALVAASPYWLYQIWGFVLPGLHANERRYSRMFAAVAGPIFFGGVALGYYVLPKGLAVLISFTPANVTNLVDFTTYFGFLTRMLLIFGIAMEIPVFVVLLNLAGVIRGEQVRRARPWIVIGTMVFAAVATPSTDPFSMLMLAIPMLLLFALSEVITRTVDRVRKRNRVTTDAWSDDEASPL
ncbi:MAG: twin-arginine translocase subunit TatC [Nocardioides sp.]